MDKIKMAHDKGYRVTKNGKFLNPNGIEIGDVQNNRLRVSIRLSKKRIIIHCHRLQAYQKFGDKMFEEGIVVRHLDGNSLNNCWDNIAIGTSSDNSMDRPEDDRIKHAKHASSFLLKYDHQEVREFHNISKSYKETMERFGISSNGTLHNILN